MTKMLTLCGAVAAAAFAVSPTVMAQTSPVTGPWVLESEDGQGAREAIAAARGAGRGAGQRAGGAVMRGGGGGGGQGRVMIRGGGPVVATMLEGGQRLDIELAADSITLQADESEPFTLPLTGAKTRVTRWGEQVEVRARPTDDGVTLETTTENGVRLTEVFTSTDAGFLEAELRLIVPSMGGQREPVVLRRVYVPAH